MFGASRTASALALALAGLLAFATATAAADEWTPPTSQEEDASPPLLEVTTTSHSEPENASEPGQTEFHIEVNFLWHVTVTVRAHGATVLNEEQGSEPFAREEGKPGPGQTVIFEPFVSWSCKQPGTVYSYEVTATSRFSEEPSLTKTGSFTGASRGQCEKARRLSARRHRKEVHEQHAQERRKLDEELARDRLYEANCRKVGGKPVTIQTNEGPEIVCRSQTGGIVEA